MVILSYVPVLLAGPEAAGMAQAGERMQTVEHLVSTVGELVTAMTAITSNVVGEVDAALAVLQDIDNEKIKQSYELMSALHDVQGVVQLADEFIAKVEDFFISAWRVKQ